MIDYDKLKAEALASPKKRSRVILVPGFDMVICLHRDSYIQYHRHPQYEAYHVMDGELEVEFERDKIPGKGTRFYMAQGGVWSATAPVVCIPPMTWHEPRSRTEFAIYREFYCGPFDKARDVEYADWSLPEAA